MLDEKARKATLRMITYGLYALGAEAEGHMAVSTVTWLTQASFEPPLVVLGVKKTSRPFQLLSKSRKLAISFLESGQRDLAYAFFKPTDRSGNTIGGFPFEVATTGAPILSDALGYIEARVVNIDETGDHAVVIAEVINAGVKRQGTPLSLRELGLNYGG
jgi:flavin reductase (DIM6/NTAB) family NADH-FMN oxidoreductase RutF